MKTLMIKTPSFKEIKVLSSVYFQVIKNSHSFFNKELVEANESDCLVEDILLKVPLDNLELFFNVSGFSKFDILMDSDSIQLKFFYVYLKDFSELSKIISILLADQDLKPIKGIPTQFGSGFYLPNSKGSDSVYINGVQMNEPTEEFPYFHIDYVDMWQTIFTMY